MAEKNLSIKLSLNDKQFQSSLKKASRSMKRFGRNLQKTGQNLTRNLTLPIVAFGAASVKAFDDQVKAETKLRTSLKGNEEAFARLTAQARELQKETLFGDEATIEAQALLSQLGLTEKQILMLTPALQDFATGMNVDLKTAASLVGKTIGTSTDALKRYFDTGLNPAMTAQEKAIVLTETLTNKFGGQAKAIAKEGLGPLTQLKNELGDVSEEFGKLVLENIEPLKKSLQGLAERLRNLTPAQKENIIQFAKYAAIIGPALIVLGKIVTVISSLAKALGTLTLATGLTGAAATALVGIMGFAILDTERFIKTALQMGKVGKFIAKVVLGALSAISPKYMAYFSVIDEVGDALDEQEKKLKNSTSEIDKNKEAVDNLNKALQGLNTTQKSGEPSGPLPTISRKGIPQFEQEKGFGEIPKKLEGVADIEPDGLKSFNDAFFKFGEGFTDTLMNTIQEVSNALMNVGNLFSLMHEKQTRELEIQRKQEIDNIMGMAIAEEEKNKMIAKSDEKFEKKKGELDRKRARREKSVAIFTAIVNTAAAVIKSLPNIPLAIATGAIGAAQIATIASTPLPAFAEGGIVSGPTVGLMGEYAGANTNPEVIAPLNKLKDMIGDQVVQVQGMISGEDIFLSNDRYSRRINSY
jgi:hypothetical protein|tara:strand:- start:1256 stop:3178 length:1923 start_codon:yes stop_codon:yes gene_type:complete